MLMAECVMVGGTEFTAAEYNPIPFDMFLDVAVAPALQCAIDGAVAIVTPHITENVFAGANVAVPILELVVDMLKPT